MDGIKSESGTDYLGRLAIFAGAFMSLCLGLATLDWIGITVPVAQSPVLFLLEMIVLTAVFFSIATALSVIVGMIVAKVLSAAERFAAVAVGASAPDYCK
jgi:hypothetical protein